MQKVNARLASNLTGTEEESMTELTLWTRHVYRIYRYKGDW